MSESPGVLFERLLDVMMRLRAPHGCPWDREQTRTSLKPYLIEEAYEVLEAIESDQSAPLKEELGDLLFQVVFHARLAEEQAEFTMGDLLEQLIGKMVRRHPHVFGDAAVGTATEALAQWEAIKQREADDRGQRRSILDGVPRAMPALLRAQRLSEQRLQLACMIVHDMRGPLTVALGGATLVAAGEGLSRQDQAMLADVNASSTCQNSAFSAQVGK